MTERQTEALEKLNRGIQKSRQEVQQRTMNLAQDYFGDSAEVLKQQIKENRSTLEGLPDQIPGGREEAFQGLFQELMDNYSAMEECVNEAQENVAKLDTDQIRRQGEVDATDAARRQAKEMGIDLTEIEGTGTDGRIIVSDVTEAAEAAENGAAQQTQDAAGEATQQVGQATQQASHVVDQTGGAAQQARDAVGQAAGAAEETAPQVDASDAAKREAQERGIDLSEVEGTGADGRIVYWDVAESAGGAEGGADPAEQLKNQASDAAGQAAGQTQQAAGQVTDQAGQVAGQAQDTAGQAAGQAQEAAGQVTDQAGQAAQGVQDAVGGLTGGGQQVEGEGTGHPVGGVTDQVGQAAGQVQDAAGGVAQQAQGTAGQATEQAQNVAGQATGRDGAEERRVTNAARRRAEEMGVDLSTVEGTGSGGLITIKDVTGS